MPIAPTVTFSTPIIRPAMAIATALVASLCFVHPVDARTDREIVQKKIKKYAVEDGQRPKAFCYCISDDSGVNGRVGHIQQYVSGNQVKVLCHSPSYDDAGEGGLGFLNCFEFEPLAK